MEFRFEPEKHRVVAYDTGEQIGVCEYVVQGSKWLIVHTEVSPSYGGQGIAKDLVLLVVEEAKKAHMEVVPICSYAVHVLKK